MSNAKLTELLKKSKNADGKAVASAQYKNIPVQITGYQNEGNDLVAKGINSLTNQEVTVSLRTYQVEEGKTPPRDMAAIKEVAPEGTIVVFERAFQDAKDPSKFVSYQARTPFNTRATEQYGSKEVELFVAPGRLIQTPGGRWGAVTFDYKNGMAMTSPSDVYEKASELFKDGRGAYLRFRVKNEDGTCENRSISIAPVWQTVDAGGGKKVSMVNVEASLQKLKESELCQMWLGNFDSIEENVGNDLFIDMMPTDMTWGGAAAFRDKKLAPEQRSYGLGKIKGFFSPEVRYSKDEDGTTSKIKDTVVTNMILAKQIAETADGKAITLTLASPLGSQANFTSIDDLPIIIDGEPAYMPSTDKIFVRVKKSDGTYTKPNAENPAKENQAAKNEDAAQAEVPSAEKAQDVDVPNIDDIDVDDMHIDDSHAPTISEEEYAEQLAAMGDDAFAGLEDISIDEILEGMQDEVPADENEATQAAKMTM